MKKIYQYLTSIPIYEMFQTVTVTRKHNSTDKSWKVFMLILQKLRVQSQATFEKKEVFLLKHIMLSLVVFYVLYLAVVNIPIIIYTGIIGNS